MDAAALPSLARRRCQRVAVSVRFRDHPIDALVTDVGRPQAPVAAQEGTAGGHLSASDRYRPCAPSRSVPWACSTVSRISAAMLGTSSLARICAVTAAAVR